MSQVQTIRPFQTFGHKNWCWPKDMKHKPDESTPLAFLADVGITSFLVVELLKGLFKGRYWVLFYMTQGENLVKNGEMRGGKKERRKRKEVGKGEEGKKKREAVDRAQVLGAGSQVNS